MIQKAFLILKIFLVACICTLFSPFFNHSTLYAQDFDSEWQDIFLQLDSGKVQSAQQLILQVKEKASKQNNYPQIIKAIIHEAALSSNGKDPNGKESLFIIYNAISSLQNDADKAVLHTILAELLWKYYESSAEEIQSRPQFIPKLYQDFTFSELDNWDALYFRKAIEHHTNQVLSKHTSLQSISIRTYTDILKVQKSAEYLRPTLYDILAFKLIAIWEQIERNQGRSDKAEFTDPLVLSKKTQFLQLPISSLKGNNLSDSPALRIASLYQHILNLHSVDNNQTASTDADIHRLLNLYSRLFHPDADSIVIGALLEIGNATIKNDATPQALVEAALLYKNREQFQKAMYICNDVQKRFPQTVAAERCKDIQMMMLDKTLSIETEATILPAKSFMFNVRYANIERIFCKIIRMEDINISNNRSRRYRNYYLNKENLQNILKAPTVINWKQELPKSSDFTVHTMRKKGPRLSSGQYLMLISPSPIFDIQGNNAIAYSFLQVSKISAISTIQKDGAILIHTIHADNGAPIKDAKIVLYNNSFNKNNDDYEDIPFDTLISDKDGLAIIKPMQKPQSAHQLSIKIIYETDTIHFQNELYSSAVETKEKEQNIHLITDRSVYRPGQVVYFKGIVYEKNNTIPQSSVLENRKIIVTVQDMQSTIIVKKEYKTGDFGSFDGQFTIPEHILPGMVSIHTELGSITILVSEYKTPTFEVLLHQTSDTSRIGSNVNIQGSVITYSGIPLSNATVKYRVLRSTQYPYWWWYWIPKPLSLDKDIAHGTVQTQGDGNFTIPFIALPEQGFDPQKAPMYNYRIVTEATEPGGETQTQELTVSIGILKAQYSIHHPQLIKSNETPLIRVHSTSLNGKSIASVKGKLIIEKLISPDKPYQKSTLSSAESGGISELDYKMFFPHESFQQEDIMLTWKSDTIVLQTILMSDSNGIAAQTLKQLKPGAYKIKYVTLEESIPFEIISSFIVYNPLSQVIPIAINELFYADTAQLQPQDTATIIFGTAWEQSSVLIQVERRGIIIKQYWDIIDNAVKSYKFPITENDRGGISIHFSMMRNHQLYSKTVEIQVPWKNKNLTISTASFRNKSMPGSKQEWTFSLVDHQQKPIKQSEITALIYDASLDQISRPQSIDFQNIWDVYSSFSKPSVLHSGNQYSSLFTTDVWNKRDQQLSIIQEYDDLSLDILINGPFGRTEIIYMNDMAQANAPRTQMLSSRGMKISPMQSSKVDDIISNQQEVAIRKNRSETALFMPKIYPNEDGKFIISCLMPEALTRWNVRLLACTKDLKSGIYENNIVTTKPLTITANAPRFVYIGDTLTLRATIHATETQNALSGQSLLDIFIDDDSLTSIQYQTSFTIKKDSSIAIAWTFPVPQAHSLRIRTIAKTLDFSDGEQIIIPVLSPRITVTDAYPLWLNPKSGTSNQSITLPTINKSNNIESEQINIKTSTIPQWYAAESLPDILSNKNNSILEDIYQWFAAKLAQGYILNNATIKKEIENGTLKGRLSQARELRKKNNISDNEHPWEKEIQQEIFRDNNLEIYTKPKEIASIEEYAFKEILRKQSPTGGYSWFELMSENRHITHEVFIAIGRIKQLGLLGTIQPEMKQLLIKGISYMDAQYEKDFDNYKRFMNPKDTFRLSIVDIEYAYARSYFKDIVSMPKGGPWDTLSLFEWKDRLQFGIKAEAMIALTLFRLGEKNKAISILQALKERAISNQDGIHWAVKGNRWFEASIETHVLVQEAYKEILKQSEIIDGVSTYLLRQKQTRNWKTTISSAQACYSILQQEEQCLTDNSKDIHVYVDDTEIKGENVSFPGDIEYNVLQKDIKKTDPIIKISSKGTCPIWGGIYRTYQSSLEDIKQYDTMSIRISTEFLRQTDNGVYTQLKRLQEQDSIHIGDRITVRITIDNERFLDYVHIKDMRSAGFELIDQLAGYSYKNGISYYQIPRDASMNFFLEYLQKGNTSIEYTLRAAREGIFNNGITTVESYYAPEYKGHSSGKKVAIYPIK